MTDKIPSDNCTYDSECTTCAEDNKCFSNYHSCANVVIDGTVERANWECLEPQD
eukprot:TRINITY_DN10209_c0_g1_i1.p3 TRINITY_DN10209_c0_g1~~TRINITY_DN10209_c0_g1_i1.p3  ORF type:complete len:54 (-),score=2.58 TRINITY_DN10209_c0_g1_i1:10-171(-)